MALGTKVILDFIKVLSWQKIFQTLIFLIMLFGAWGFWENRTTIYNTIRVGARVETDAPFVIELSPGTKSYIENTMSKSKDLVAGLQLLNVNFKKNSRYTSHFFFNSQALKNGYEGYMSSKIADNPLFTDSEINNQRLINLINGDFVCYDFKDTPGFRLYHGADKDVVMVCSISIPPYYGRFSGYMNLHLYRKPKNEEMVFVRQMARDISLRIFEQDINKNNSNLNTTPTYGKN